MALNKSRTFSPLEVETEEEMSPMAAMPEGEGEILSMSLLGGKDAKPGDVVRIRVQSVNEDDGTWTGVYAQSEDDEGEMEGVEQTIGAKFAPPA